MRPSFRRPGLPQVAAARRCVRELSWLLVVLAAVTGLVSSTPARAEPGTTAQPAQPAAQELTIFLLLGQSNMAGRDISGLADQKTDPRVLALDANGVWAVAKDPIHRKTSQAVPGVGPGLPFALALLEHRPDLRIGLVPCAVGGTSIRRWSKNGDLFKAAVEQARVAATRGTLAGILWHQGETDAEGKTTAGAHAEKLAQVVRDLREALGRPDLPFVAGQLGDFLPAQKFPSAEAVHAAIATLPSLVERARVVSADGLTDKGDRLHFSATASRELGSRFARAMIELQPALPHHDSP